MANETDLEMLTQGLEGWNIWLSDARSSSRKPDLRGADLHGVDLRGADLGWADLGGCDLSEARLVGADLRGANLSGADLTGVDFGHVTTDFWNHLSGRFTVPQNRQIVRTQLAALPAFLSYRTVDAAFADKLYASLRRKGIQVWQDKHDLQLGDRLDETIIKTVRESERILVVCSRNSLTPENWGWVNREVGEAFEREERYRRKTGDDIDLIIPLDIDGFLFDEDCTYHRGRDLRNRLGGQFQDWKSNPEAFNDQVNRLVHALRNPRSLSEHRRKIADPDV